MGVLLILGILIIGYWLVYAYVNKIHKPCEPGDYICVPKKERR